MKNSLFNASKRRIFAAVCILLSLVLLFGTGSAFAAELDADADAANSLSSADTVYGGDSSGVSDSDLADFLDGFVPQPTEVASYYDLYITYYDVDMTLNADRSVDVVETIDAWFNEPSHGITRELPGYSSAELFVIDDFTVEGVPFEWYTDTIIRIGDPNEYVTGAQRYVLSYTVSYFEDTYVGYDRFYRDMLGSETSMPVCNFTGRVRLPDGVVPEDMIFYSDTYGGIENLYVDYMYSGGVIYVCSTQQLPDGCAVTLDLKLPDGAFSETASITPDLVVNSLDVDMRIDPHGHAIITEQYDITANRDCRFLRDLGTIFAYSDYTIKTRSFSVNNLNRFAPTGRTDHVIYFSAGDHANVTIEYELYLLVDSDNPSEFIQFRLAEFDRDTLTRYDSIVFDIESYTGEGTIGYRCGVDTVPEDVDPDTLAYGFHTSSEGGRMHAESFGTFPVGESIYITYDSEVPLTRKSTTADYAFPGLIALMLTVLGVGIFNRKEKELVPTIEFYPPGKLNPAEIGFALNGNVEGKDITTLIYYWASHGHLSIEMTGKTHYTLHKLSELDDAHRDYEKTLFSQLWALGNGSSIGDSTIEKGDIHVTDKQLEDKFYSKIARAVTSVKNIFTASQAIEDESARKRSNIFFWACLGIFLILGFAFSITSPFGTAFPFPYFCTIIGTIVLAFIFTTSSSIRKARYNGKTKVGSYILCAILAVVFFVCMLGFRGAILGTVPLIIIGIAMPAFAFFTPQLRRRTDFGTELIGRCMGFRDFLETAEKDRLEMLLEENPNYYYDILPYAQVLGVSTIWEKKFEGMLSQAPDWFYGPDVTHMTYRTLMHRNMSSISRNMTSVPYESSGGGGSIGGGFGGGGFSGGGGGFGGGFSGGGGGGGVGRW